MVYETVIGAVGGMLVLLAFVLSSSGKLHRSTYKYIAINGVGSAILIYYGLLTNAIIFIGLNIVWVAVEIYWLIKRLTKK